MSDFACPTFEPQTSYSRGHPLTARLLSGNLINFVTTSRIDNHIRLIIKYCFDFAVVNILALSYIGTIYIICHKGVKFHVKELSNLVQAVLIRLASSCPA